MNIYQIITERMMAVIAALDLGQITDSDLRASLSFCDMQFGDVASNIALTSTKKVNIAPQELARQIAHALPDDMTVLSADVAGPGFINIRLRPQVWLEYAQNIGPDYFCKTQSSPKNVNIEFISANPTGPLVLVNAWGGYYGDILANIFASQGFRVSREYYLNDGGNQITQLGKAIQQACGKKFEEEVSKELYRGDYVNETAEKIIQEYGSADTVIKSDPQQIGDKAKEIIFTSYIKPALHQIGIHHEHVFRETSLNNRITVERIRQAGLLKESDGATWLDGEKAGLDHDEVLIRSTDSQDTYFLKDISYQINKLETRQYDTAITIVGPDHHGQAKRLSKTLELLGVRGFVPLWTQTVRLIKDGVEFKMSKRRGNYIVLDEFLEKVPSDTARFFFAMRDTNSHFDMDLDIVAAQNSHNPLYYVLYSTVRAHSILAKADPKELEMATITNLTDKQVELLRGFEQIANSIRLATETYQVHPILHQMIEQARNFHDWYEHTPILKADNQSHRISHMAFLIMYIEVMESFLKLLGITPLRRM
ncbi:arginine--tRNA ligase [Candidatus Saccharibacteria bacterium]|nr:arginine--tRNA ligase [Candidatus Saccharibacteria bacterium]